MPELINRQQVLDILQTINDPETGRSLVRMEQVGEIEIDDASLRVEVGLTSWAAPLWEELQSDIRRKLVQGLPQAKGIQVEIVPHERPAEKLGQIGLTAKSVVAVGSGKGGVGKSTIAASIAYGLMNAGAKVGLMDADVYGPSIPHLLGVEGRPTVVDKRLQPIVKDGMPVMSMGFLVAPDEAVDWRGPLRHGAITQFLRHTDWGDLDYLIIDMPPGTGDIALTLSQMLPLSGAVVVCTPQDVALLDAVKAIAMFEKVNIPRLGMVENMSYFLCPDNGKRYDIFGSGGAKATAERLGVPFLGEVPINISIRQRGDAGDTSGNLSDSETATYFRVITQAMVRSIINSRKGGGSLPTLPTL